MWKTISLLMLASLCFSCGFESDMESLSIGNDFLSSRSTLSVVDSFTVSMSTVMIDSLTTSGDKLLWSGSYQDPELGKISSTGYYELGVPDNPDIQEKDVYDSLLLVMNLSTGWYGDTTVYQSLQVHRVTQELEGDESNNFWNRTRLTYEPNPLGTVRFRPKPGLKSKVTVRLSDALGQKLFDLVKADDESVATFEKFREFFKGLALVPGDQSSAILSFPCDSSMKVALYSHRKGLEQEDFVNYFPVGSTSTFFNNFTADRTGTPIAAIARQIDEVPSSQSNNKTYVQSGIGLVTRIDFPTMQQLNEMDRKFILLKAELVLSPLPGSYKQIQLPSELVLYHTDKSNRMVSEIVGDQNATLAADLVVDKIFNEATTYTFDITDFLSTEISDSFFDTSHGLLIGEPSASLGASLNRVVFSSNKNNAWRPVVRLYFMHYNL
ncbi:MAG TPA: DUF4270 family protein [Prolixibacteraceae bacterium]|nr:DUF4270 family protein [Prolixibacteraceae bacterium]